MHIRRFFPETKNEQFMKAARFILLWVLVIGAVAVQAQAPGFNERRSRNRYACPTEGV